MQIQEWDGLEDLDWDEFDQLITEREDSRYEALERMLTGRAAFLRGYDDYDQTSDTSLD